MGRAPCCDKANVKKGPWSPEEDAKLKEYIEKNGTGGNWIALPQKAGLKRCGKSCRLRWLNYLRPNIKHGEFSDDEDRIICSLYANIGSRWSIIAAQLPGRTDNDIKNYWNTKLKKKLMGMNNGNNPAAAAAAAHQRIIRPHHLATSFSSLLHQASSLPSSPSSSTPPMSTTTSSSPPPYNYYTLPARSFTEPVVPFSSSPLSTSTTSLINSASLNPLQTQDSLMGPMLMFGGDQASCSSSDGSCNNNHNNNQMSHGKEMEYNEYGHGNNYNFYSNGMEESQSLVASNGMWGDINPLEYGLEEIKQLISSTSSCNNNIIISNNNNFLLDEIKTEGRVMY